MTCSLLVPVDYLIPVKVAYVIIVVSLIVVSLNNIIILNKNSGVNRKDFGDEVIFYIIELVLAALLLGIALPLLLATYSVSLAGLRLEVKLLIIFGLVISVYYPVREAYDLLRGLGLGSKNPQVAVSAPTDDKKGEDVKQ